MNCQMNIKVRIYTKFLVPSSNLDTRIHYIQPLSRYAELRRAATAEVEPKKRCNQVYSLINYQMNLKVRVYTKLHIPS